MTTVQAALAPCTRCPEFAPRAPGFFSQRVMPLASALIRAIRFPLFAALLAAAPLAPAAAGARLAVLFSPDGSLLATDRCDAVDVWAVATGARVASVPVGRCGHELAIGPDSRMLVGGSGYAGCHAWHLPTGEQAQTLYPPEDRTTVAAFAFSPDGRRRMELAGHAPHRPRTWTLSPPAAQ